MNFQRRAQVLRVLVSVAAVTLPLAVVGMLMWQGPQTPYGLGVSQDASQSQLWLSALVGLAPMVVGVWILMTMRALLGLYAQGHALSVEAAGDIRRIGLGLVLMGLLPLLIRPVQSVLLSWNNPAGERALTVGVGSGDVGFLLGGALMLLIAWAMAEAAEAAAENRAFV